MPVDTTVTLDIAAQDVAHSWWIPKLGGKFDAVPGYTNHTWFKIPKPGVYSGPVRRAVRAQPRRHDRPGPRRVTRPSSRRGSRTRRQEIAAANAAAAAAQEVPDRQASNSPRNETSATTWPPPTRSHPVPQIVAHAVERARARLDELDHDDRPQADRDPLHGHDLRVLPAGRRRGAADAPAARGAEQHAGHARDLQPAVHDARHDDDLPVRRADDGRASRTTSCR